MQFLRLLGAGAIGYFAYRAGFIDSLFGNATAAGAAATTSNVGSIAGIPLSQSAAVPRAATTEKLDEDGILMMGVILFSDNHLNCC